ncbi:MAG: hypothetical protein M3Y51_01240, partial [Actinomycetota bacterium]|nr:hypothetical protein [Actinomycetota bacterium]
IATVIGGLGSLLGAVSGAVFQRGAQWLLPAPWSYLATGLGVLVVLITLPDGLGGLIWRGRDAALRRIARARGIEVLAFDRSTGDPDVDPPAGGPPDGGAPDAGSPAASPPPAVVDPVDEAPSDAEVVA